MPIIEPGVAAERAEKMKASIRAKIEHSFQAIEQLFGFTNGRSLGVTKNTAADRRAVEALDGATPGDGG